MITALAAVVLFAAAVASPMLSTGDTIGVQKFERDFKIAVSTFDRVNTGKPMSYVAEDKKVYFAPDGKREITEPISPSEKIITVCTPVDSVGYAECFILRDGMWSEGSLLEKPVKGRSAAFAPTAARMAAPTLALAEEARLQAGTFSITEKKTDSVTQFKATAILPGLPATTKTVTTEVSPERIRVTTVEQGQKGKYVEVLRRVKERTPTMPSADGIEPGWG